MSPTSLSKQQEAIWLTQQLNDSSPLFNVGGYASIRGKVNWDLLSTAIDEVMSTADVLNQVNQHLCEHGATSKDLQPLFLSNSKDFSSHVDAANACSVASMNGSGASALRSRKQLTIADMVRCDRP